MKYLKLFENFYINEEVDSSLIGGIAKNLYSYLSKIEPNNPVDLDGLPLKNTKGDTIAHNKKVSMNYQSSVEGMDKLAMQGKSIQLGQTQGSEITLRYSQNMIYALGFVKKEEAESALQEILKKYQGQVSGEVKTNKMDYEWAKNWAPTYSVIIKMKDDKQQAREKTSN